MAASRQTIKSFTVKLPGYPVLYPFSYAAYGTDYMQIIAPTGFNWNKFFPTFEKFSELPLEIDLDSDEPLPDTLSDSQIARIQAITAAKDVRHGFSIEPRTVRCQGNKLTFKVNWDNEKPYPSNQVFKDCIQAFMSQAIQPLDLPEEIDLSLVFSKPQIAHDVHQALFDYPQLAEKYSIKSFVYDPNDYPNRPQSPCTVRIQISSLEALSIISQNPILTLEEYFQQSLPLSIAMLDHPDNRPQKPVRRDIMVTTPDNLEQEASFSTTDLQEAPDPEPKNSDLLHTGYQPNYYPPKPAYYPVAGGIVLINPNGIEINPIVTIGSHTNGKGILNPTPVDSTLLSPPQHTTRGSRRTQRNSDNIAARREEAPLTTVRGVTAAPATPKRIGALEAIFV